MRRNIIGRQTNQANNVSGRGVCSTCASVFGKLALLFVFLEHEGQNVRGRSHNFVFVHGLQTVLGYIIVLLGEETS